jgi:hypothetical protein
MPLGASTRFLGGRTAGLIRGGRRAGGAEVVSEVDGELVVRLVRGPHL